MPLFYYRAADATGRIIQGSLEAREERLVVQHLQQGGLIPLRITGEEQPSGWAERLGVRRPRRITHKQVFHFTEELTALLKAGLPLERSLQALLTVTRSPGPKAMLSQILQDLQAGKALSEALARHPAFSPLYLSMVRAGETGGFLEVALQRLGEYLKTFSELRGYLISALIYPMILAIVGGLSVILMLVYVVPRFEIFFREMGPNLYVSTQVLLGLSRAFRAYWWLGLLLILVTALASVRLARRPGVRLIVDRVKLRAPLVGTLSRKVCAAMFAKTFGTLLNNGVALVAAFQVVVETVTNRYLAHSFGGLLKEVKKGQRLSALFKKTEMFPELFLQMVAIGEETGRLAEMLLASADSMESEIRAGVQRVLALLEPCLILSMALVVGFIIVSLLLPILNLYEVSF